MKDFSRREFLRWTLAGAAGLSVSWPVSAFLQPIDIENPLGSYPDRDWETVYRDKYKYDSIFTFTCAPNDTHNCILRAYVRNGIIVRVMPTYGFSKAKDYYGNQATARWEPRCCNKAIVLSRRFYGDRRLKGTMVRKGFYEWVKAGFPRGQEDGKPPKEYFKRGEDTWLKVPHEEAFDIVAKALANIGTTYSGQPGKDFLERQGYDPAMLEKMAGAGTQVLKFRGGMPLLGITRLLGLVRMANMMAILDTHIRQTTPQDAVGGRHFDNYSWHTDLPPGHPMVSGQQTNDCDLSMAEHAKFILLIGMNWICTKMPDSHWLTEARQRGSKVVTIATEYQATANKCDEVIVIRPGTDHALLLGIARILMEEKLFDEDYVKTFTDLPILVRTDNLQYLRASEVVPGYQLAALKQAVVFTEDKSVPPPGTHEMQYVNDQMRAQWGDHLVWNVKTDKPEVINRDMVGEHFKAMGVEPALKGKFKVTTIDGAEVEVRTVFDILTEYLNEFTVENVSEITWTPVEAIKNLAQYLAQNKASTFLAVGMGPNQFFNAALKDRGIHLVAALTNNIGHIGGSNGSFAGNYRIALYNGLPQFIIENPFEPELNPTEMAKPKPYLKFESAHYFSHGDKPLRHGNKLFTGSTHIPTPTKFLWFANSNSIIGNAKWSYDLIVNTMPKVEAIVMNEWWWTMSCEYSDVVFGVDSWAEFKTPDMCGSVTNPFNQVFPRSPINRIHDTIGDIETYAGVAKALSKMTNDKRFENYWHFIYKGEADVYLDRIIKASTSLKGYKFSTLEELAFNGIPSMKNLRTYPKVVGWEQTNENKPWYTKTGRLEFYREEQEFIETGENLPVYREPIDATFYEPNVIVAGNTPMLRPMKPDQYGFKEEDLDTESRQVRNIVKSWQELKKTNHPLKKLEGYKYIFLTPKYRHGSHSTPIDLDVVTVWYGPFGDLFRHDKRMPWVGEAYVYINPADARENGINDGDYIWIDADPEDRPYHGWKKEDKDYKVARLMCRARYYKAVPQGILMMWHNQYQSTHGTVKGHEENPDGLARNPLTNYQSLFRYGGHQSATRAWLGPTLMTDSLVRKDVFGQKIGKGFLPDIHCPVGAPRESFVKVTKAEDGGIGGKGLWRPAAAGFTAGNENDVMKRYLNAEYIA
ncbi:MAG: molybdopterin-dependent oxidoreductase [Candidatus Magnetoovum sp. WYHC-5]|nr:molybdopterin-dependent oxidoreductase [Candidatus Magnetoovum sp. WYHC-5]